MLKKIEECISTITVRPNELADVDGRSDYQNDELRGHREHFNLVALSRSME